ncbi:MAG: ATP/GTP-binding protein [Bulleidia sp.]
MIVLNLKLDGIYGFDQFEISFTYPKKIANSLIQNEYLQGRERFRYKKAVILMGANATGKTSLGKALFKIATYLNTGNVAVLFDMVIGSVGSFTIDFVNTGLILHRVKVTLNAETSEADTMYWATEIDKMDSYEMCVEKLVRHPIDTYAGMNPFRKTVGPVNYRFAYPEIESSMDNSKLDENVFVKTLRAVISTLDPTLKDVSVSRDLKDTYIIRRKNQAVIIQEGKLLNRDMFSSGTAEGIDVAVFLASMLSRTNAFYYCDEHFSCIQSDIEKRIFGLMLDRIPDHGQLIFTTHNTDMLDLNLPKHSFMFLRKEYQNSEYRTTAISASDILKRNTDSVRCAYENDVFHSIPDDSPLDELELGWRDE